MKATKDSFKAPLTPRGGKEEGGGGGREGGEITPTASKPEQRLALFPGVESAW